MNNLESRPQSIEVMDRHPPASGLSRLRRTLAAQKPTIWAAELSVVLTAVGVAVFWAALLAGPEATEAGTVLPAGIDPDQLTLSASRDLPGFDDTYQRHIGVLDTLDAR